MQPAAGRPRTRQEKHSEVHHATFVRAMPAASKCAQQRSRCRYRRTKCRNRRVVSKYAKYHASPVGRLRLTAKSRGRAADLGWGRWKRKLYTCLWKRVGRRSAGALGPDSRCRLFPANPAPPPARPAFVLPVRGPHWIGVHQLAPEIRDSRLGRHHRSTFPIVEARLPPFDFRRPYDYEIAVRCSGDISRGGMCTSNSRFCTCAGPSCPRLRNAAGCAALGPDRAQEQTNTSKIGGRAKWQGTLR